MEQLTREERIARIRKMREERRRAFLERRQAFLEKGGKMPSIFEKFNFPKREEKVEEKPAEEKKKGRKKKTEEIITLDELNK